MSNIELTAPVRLLAAIAQVESDFAVNELNYRGVCIWPVIRAMICEAAERDLAGESLVDPNVTDGIAGIEARLSGDVREILEIGAPQPLFFGGPGLKTVNLAPVCDGLFFSRREQYTATRNKVWSCGLLDQLYPLLSEKNSILKFEEYNEQALNTLPRFNETVFFRTPWQCDPERFRERFFARMPAWPEADALAVTLKGMGQNDSLQGLVPNLAEVHLQLAIVDSYAYFMSGIVGSLKPKVIFVDDYCNPASWGLILLARQQNIPTVEVNPRLTGDNRWPSTHWTCVPEDGYELLPDFFWVFDQETKQGIERHMESQIRPHRAIVAGDSSLDYWARAERGRVSADQKSYLANLRDSPFVVLAVLDYRDLTPATLLKAVQMLPPDWAWMFYIQTPNDMVGDILTKVLERNGLFNVQVQLSNRIRIYELLEHADHVVTTDSPIAVEARAFGVDATVIAASGVDYFAGYIAANRIEAAPTSGSIVRSLRQSFEARIPRQKERRSSAVEKHSLHDRALQELLADWHSHKDWNAARRARIIKSAIFAERITTNLFSNPVPKASVPPRPRGMAYIRSKLQRKKRPPEIKSQASVGRRFAVNGNDGKTPDQAKKDLLCPLGPHTFPIAGGDFPNVPAGETSADYSLFVFFDRACLSNQSNALVAICLAELERRQLDLKFIQLVVVPDVGPKQLKYSMPASWSYMANSLLKSCAGIVECGSRDEADNVLRSLAKWIYPKGYTVAAPVALPSSSALTLLRQSLANASFCPSDEAKNHIEAWRRTNSKGRRIVTLTLSQNSDPAAWASFLGQVDQDTYHFILLGDWPDALPPEFGICERFAEGEQNIELMSALHARAHLNLISGEDVGQEILLNVDASWMLYLPPSRGNARLSFEELDCRRIVASCKETPQNISSAFRRWIEMNAD